MSLPTALDDNPTLHSASTDITDVLLDVQDDDQHLSVPSTPRRRKRGARKGKGALGSGHPKDDTLDTLAAASQSLARELSKTSRPPSLKTTSSSQQLRAQFEPVSFFPVPTALCGSSSLSPPPSLHDSASSWRSKSNTSLPVPSVSAAADIVSSTSSPAKKSSKWKLGFIKANGSRPFSDASQDPGIDARIYGVAMSATASNVSDLIMGLSSASVPSHHTPKPSSSASASAPSSSRLNKAASQPSLVDKSGADSETRSNHSRGRRSKQRAANRDESRSRSRHSNVSSTNNDHPAFHFNYKDSHKDNRAVSPSSSWSVGQTSSGGSLSSAATSTSVFSRFSTGSSRSLSTTATSASSSSWRHLQPPTSPRPTSPDYPAGLPRNIKYMTEMAWEPNTVPYEHRPVSTDDTDSTVRFPRKQRSRKLKGPDLGTINERPGPPKHQRPLKDASTSTTDLGFQVDEEAMEGVRRAQRPQGNPITKMFHVLRR